MTHAAVKFSFATLVAGVLALQALALNTADYPETAQAGQCFARVLTPEVTETLTEQVEITPASTKQVVVPAAYETQIIRVEVKQASTAFRTIPAVYETVTEQILVEPEREVLVAVPATYDTWTETVEIEPAKAVWRTGSSLYGRGMAGTGTAPLDGHEVATGEVLCRVMEPAKTATVRHTRMVTPPRTERRTVAAKYRTVSKQVVKTPSRVEEVTLAAEFLDIPVEIMTRPETVETEIIPAVYRTVDKRVVQSKANMQWAEVLCDTNSNRSKIADIQRELTNAGFATAPDGIFGPKTQTAMEQYQRANGLAVGYMTVETVRALNVDPYV